MKIWNFTDYRLYLLEKLGADGSRTGLRKQLAAAIPVHTTFVSQVLKGRAEFSLEQAEAINGFLEHTDDEGEYFILLLLKERSENLKLRARFDRKIKAMRDERLNIQSRLDVQGEISLKDRERFYSSHIYGAVHVLTGIPDFKTVDALADATKTSRGRMRDIVDFLLRLGVLKEIAGELSPGPAHVHLSNESELILRHHTNWRMHTINNLQFLDRDDLHYSAGLTLSREDAFRVKESILQNLKSNVDIISKSQEEVAYVLNFDFYKLLS